MPRLIRSPLIEARSRYFDSAGWNDYRPRPDDIIIATYPKCGTTWIQRVVGMLIFRSDAPFPVQESSPWPDFRLAPPAAMLELAESQTHRRFFKSHLPYDALPIYEGVKIIHVARDGRDAAMSFYNHKINYTDAIIDRMTAVLQTDPKFDTPVQRIESDPARHEPSVLLVHYADLKADLGREMRRIAEFLEIRIEERIWPDLIEAASFESMKNKADELMPTAGDIWQGGGDTFLHKGVNGRWRDICAASDLALYDTKVQHEFSRDLAHWIEFGRMGV